VVVSGNIAAKYEDVAEWVKAPSKLAAGTVLIIDPGKTDQMLRSKAYDTRVAGVASARPGVLLGDGGKGKMKVAHSGRVEVKVDASFGAIAAGDLLVTSPTPRALSASRGGRHHDSSAGPPDRQGAGAARLRTGRDPGAPDAPVVDSRREILAALPRRSDEIPPERLADRRDGALQPALHPTL
jgi:hypothetical protein